MAVMYTCDICKEVIPTGREVKLDIIPCLVSSDKRIELCPWCYDRLKRESENIASEHRKLRGDE